MNEADWDAFAATYAQVQAESRLPIQTDVVAALAARLPLTKLSVLDLAAGSGRYSLPLAQAAKHVEVLDWSKEMLKQAKALLSAHQVTNVTLTQADWTALAPAPRADLVFVSQLPTLTPQGLPKLLTLAKQAVAINWQIEAANTLVTQIAQQLGVPVPIPAQAEPRRATAMTQALTSQHRPYTSQVFRYHRREQLAVSDVLDAFDRPFTLSEATRLATAVGASNANQLLSIEETYAFQLIIIPTT